MVPAAEVKIKEKEGILKILLFFFLELFAMRTNPEKKKKSRTTKNYEKRQKLGLDFPSAFKKFPIFTDVAFNSAICGHLEFRCSFYCLSRVTILLQQCSTALRTKQACEWFFTSENNNPYDRARVDCT